jgi:hypothetical protein
MLGRSKRDRREKIAIALKQREKLPSRCKENKTVAVSTFLGINNFVVSD